jgi:hypothetical protein
MKEPGKSRLQPKRESELAADDPRKLGDWNSLLQHRVAIPNRDLIILE